MDSWPRRGHEYQGQDGANFLRAEPNLDLCNGFFVALLKRRKKKRKSAEQDTATEEMSVIGNGDPITMKEEGQPSTVGINEEENPMKFQIKNFEFEDKGEKDRNFDENCKMMFIEYEEFLEMKKV